MAFWKFGKKKSRHRKVRRMGNFATYAEVYIYILLALVILGNIFYSLYKSP